MLVFFHLLPCHHRPLFVFHVSQTYSKTGETSVLYSLRFVLLEMFSEHQILCNLENAPLVVRVCFSGLLYHLSAISQISNSFTSSILCPAIKIISWFSALIVINFCLCHVDRESHLSGFDLHPFLLFHLYPESAVWYYIMCKV